jgi:hypothetical protein
MSLVTKAAARISGPIAASWTTQSGPMGLSDC